MHKTIIIGLGGRGQAWARETLRHECFDVHGIADINPETTAEHGQAFGVPEANRHTDYASALGTGRYDTAIIVAPNHLHYPICEEAIRCGVHCLVEKPFTERLDHALELVDDADKRSLVLVVGQNYRYKPHIKHLTQYILGGELGRLSGIEGNFHRYRPPRYEHERVMRYPMLYLQAIHHFDWLLSMLPAPIAELRSQHTRPEWSRWENPSICQVIFRCEDGVTVSYRGSYESRGEISPYDGIWRFEFENGDLMLDAAGVAWRITRNGEQREPIDIPREEAETSESQLLSEFADAISNGNEPATSGRRNLETLRLLFRVMGDL